VQRGFDDWRAMSPPMWFLGAYEMTVGHIVLDVPRGRMHPRIANSDRINSALYRERRDEFPPLARRAGVAVSLTFLVAALAYLWNARRMPALAPAAPPAFRRRWALSNRLANAVLVRQAPARAGFYFTLAAMWRSNTHRLTLACAAAAGFAMAVVALSNSSLQQGAGASPRLLAMQPLLYGALLIGFRHAIRVPAELRANWGFQLAWRGREREFVAGVKWAAVIALVLPALAVLLPLLTFVLGLQLALMHAALGLVGAIVFLEALMINYDKVPFTCTYIPSENMKALAPIYALAFLIGASMFARMQYDALYGDRAIGALITLAIAFVILRVITVKRARLPYVEFDEAPATRRRGNRSPLGELLVVNKALSPPGSFIAPRPHLKNVELCECGMRRGFRGREICSSCPHRHAWSHDAHIEFVQFPVQPGRREAKEVLAAQLLGDS
jgi:uncharacterized membrane protein YagU involved in acid resistance